MFEKCKNQIDSKNGWLLLSASLAAKFGLVFVLTKETLFRRGFVFKRKSIGSSENGTRDWHVFI